MEDEEDIFVGDMVTCVVRVVRENELKEGVTAKQVLAGEMPEEEEEEEEPFSPPENATPVSTPSEEESTNETWGEWIAKGFWSLLGYSCIPLFQETEYNEKEFIV